MFGLSERICGRPRVSAAALVALVAVLATSPGRAASRDKLLALRARV